MPATRGKNLRSGDLAEQLGLLLLQSVALVAPVPRTEDVGIDAVATLIKDFDSYTFIAEDSFFVQIKSSSVTGIEFDEKQTAWLFALELPFFIGRVDRTASEMHLYCAHRLSNALITNFNRKQLTIHLDDQNIDDEFVDKDDANIHIGPPVLTWSLNTIQEDEAFLENAYSILKQHITVYKTNLELRRVGWIHLLHWETNQLPQKYGEAGASAKEGLENLNTAYDLLMPYFTKWIKELLFSKDFTHAKDVVKLLDHVKQTIDKINNIQ